MGANHTYRILYYYWGEVTYTDGLSTLKEQGHEVEVFSHPFSDYFEDEEFTGVLSKALKNGFDFIFSFNYFPILSEAAKDADILYVCWIYDSPHYTLDALNLSNPCNRIFHFDRKEVSRYKALGVEHIYHFPLGVNCRRLEQLTGKNNKTADGMQGPDTSGGENFDVCFLGSLYDDQYNFYDQIQYLPPELKGYCDALIASQQKIWGYDFFDELFDENRVEEMARYVQVGMGEKFRDNRGDIFRGMMRKKVTVQERKKLLYLAGEYFPLVVYAPAKPSDIQCTYKGTADYDKEMPLVFYRSKVNLNISLRSILSGIPLRCMDVLGTGGFLLSNYQEELSEYFKMGEEAECFTSPEELIGKIDWYLSHDAEREKIARAGHEAVKKQFDYSLRWQEMFKTLE